MGVSGSGKSTTGARLARALGWPFRDADSFHPPANIAKMRRGVALEDEDRWPWLTAIAQWIDARRAAGEAGIVSCSALKRDYRRRLIGEREGVRLVYLKGSEELIADRISRRTGHFMPSALLHSQFAVLEEPGPEERPIVVPVILSPQRVVAAIIAGLAGPLPTRLP
jgi:gluconokinase